MAGLLLAQKVAGAAQVEVGRGELTRRKSARPQPLGVPGQRGPRDDHGGRIGKSQRPMDARRRSHYPFAMPVKSPLYDSDFYAWSRQQADLLRAGKLTQADIENIAEEIESMGRTEKRELVSRLEVLLLHLLKWRYQPDRRGPSWEASIRVQRYGIEDHLDDNPSLKPLMPQALASAFRKARVEAVAETGLTGTTFPETCPWTVEQVLDGGFWPG